MQTKQCMFTFLIFLYSLTLERCLHLMVKIQLYNHWQVCDLMYHLIYMYIDLSSWMVFTILLHEHISSQSCASFINSNLSSFILKETMQYWGFLVVDTTAFAPKWSLLPYSQKSSQFCARRVAQMLLSFSPHEGEYWCYCSLANPQYLSTQLFRALFDARIHSHL